MTTSDKYEKEGNGPHRDGASSVPEVLRRGTVIRKSGQLFQELTSANDFVFRHELSLLRQGATF